MTTSYRIAISLWTLFFTLACWVAIQTTTIQTELALLLPEKSSVTQQLLVDHIRQGSTSRLILLGLRGTQQDTLAKASKMLANMLRENSHISIVHNGDMTHLQNDLTLLFQHRYLLSPNITVQKFQESALQATLQQRLRDVASFLPPFMKNHTTKDVTGEFLEILKVWTPSQTLKRHNGVWISSQGDTALLTVETAVSGFDLDTQEHIQQDLQAAVSQVNASLARDDQIELIATGPAVFAVESRRTIKEEAQWLSFLATLLVMTFLFMTYRSPTLVALTIVPLASGLLTGILTINLVFGYIHGVTLAFGATLIGVAIDYPIHVISHLSSRQSTVHILRQLWPVIGLGAITTALGYCAMLFSGFPGLSQLGLFAIVGLLTSALVTRFVLPSMIPNNLIVPSPAGTWMALTQKLPRQSIILPLIFLLSLGYLIWSPNIFWEQNIANLSPLSQDAKDLDRRLRKEVGAPGMRDLIVVTGQSEEAVLQEEERLIPTLTEQMHLEVLTGYELAAQYLPSRMTQQQRQTQLPSTQILQERIEHAQAGLPFKQGIFEPFIQDIDIAQHQDSVNTRTFHGTSLGMKLQSLLFQQDHTWIGVIQLHGVTNRAQLHTLFPPQTGSNSYYLDLKHEADLMITTYRDEVIRFLGIGAIAIILVLLIRLKSSSLVIRIVGTVAVSVVTVLALLHLLGEHISLFHLSSLLLVVGLGLDYALFFHHQHLEPEVRTRTIWAIVICSTTTIIVFGLLAFSQTPVLHSIGLTAALGSLCCLFFSALSSQTMSEHTRNIS